MKKDKKKANGVDEKKPGKPNRKKKWSARGKQIQKGRLKALKRQLEEVEEDRKKFKELANGAKHTIEDQSIQLSKILNERARRMTEEKKIAVVSALSYILWEAFEEIGLDDTRTIVEVRSREYVQRPGAGATIENNDDDDKDGPWDVGPKPIELEGI